MIMALLMADEQDNQEKEQKIFLSLVFWGLAALVLVFVLALVGVYRVAL
jgi:dicarboxylate carrier protein